ncbi:site-specific integrase [Robiginitalea sp. M366]|uniref:site-specific integrase n=1 Tax=Robiginitalea aestuariiviva TaxID=3036903 RepID=UPI00240E8E20|nr:site-specific integrase [Robiginitalea aestuariiviva]MDG1573282.1 site-specific integrase [Robiginitalea aestuariiviva]
MGTSRTFSIHFWLNLSKRNGDLAPIYARITVDGRRSEISLKRLTSVTYWDTKSRKTTGKSPESRSINSYLDQVQVQLYECYNQLRIEGKLVTAKLIKSRFVGQEDLDKTLLQLITYHNDRMAETLRPGTLKNYFSTERYIKRFLVEKRKTRDEYLKHLDYSFIIDFEHYLRKASPLQKGRSLNQNGIMKHMERLKKMMNLAVDLEWLERNPFSRFKLRFKKFKKEFLTRQELAAFEEIEFKDSGLQTAKDVFVFCCYTGLSYCDIRQLSYSNLVRGIDGEKWIHTSRTKNNVPVRVPLLRQARSIIDRYMDKPKKFEGQLLPVISNQRINDFLVEICDSLGIYKHITFHSARHTFATTVTLSNGVPIESVSKMLGHTKITTTQVYARVLDEKISGDMRDLQSKLEGNVPYSKQTLKAEGGK